MKAKVTITKSFDKGKEFTKEWEPKDFAEFFADEGEYLDRLGNSLLEHGNKGDSFTVTYTVELTK